MSGWIILNQKHSIICTFEYILLCLASCTSHTIFIHLWYNDMILTYIVLANLTLCLTKFEGGDMLHEMFSYVKKSRRLWKAKTYQSWTSFLPNWVSELACCCFSLVSTSSVSSSVSSTSPLFLPSPAVPTRSWYSLPRLNILRIINEPTAVAIVYSAVCYF